MNVDRAAVYILPAALLFAVVAVFWPAIAYALAQLGPDIIGDDGQAAATLRDTIAGALNIAPEEVRYPDFLAALGLYVDRLAAGLAGGFVRLHRAATRRRRTSPAAWVTGLAAGAVTANYVALLVTSLFPDLGSGVVLVASFVLGYGGEPLLDRIVEGVAHRAGRDPYDPFPDGDYGDDQGPPPPTPAAAGLAVVAPTPES